MPRRPSHLELLAGRLLSEFPGEKPVPEFRFHPTRKWRFDFAYPEKKIAIEIEGGVWTGGAHTRGKHFESDCEKYNAATLLGWRALRFTGGMVERGEIGVVCGAFDRIFPICNSDLLSWYTEEKQL